VHAAQVDQAIDTVCAAAKKSNKIPGIYCRDAESAVAMAKRGYRFVIAGNDQTTLRAATVMQLKALKS
jgi:2-keto-3-deoxy-L-rhamnonate aldolase RhmA